MTIGNRISVFEQVVHSLSVHLRELTTLMKPQASVPAQLKQVLIAKPP